MSGHVHIYEGITRRIAEVSQLEEVIALLDWDMQCFMPESASDGRSNQLSLLRRMQHEVWIHPETASLLAQAEKLSTASPYQKRNLKLIRQEFDKKTKLPPDLVERIAKVTGDAYPAWAKAKSADDWDSFAPLLEKIIELKKEEAKAMRSGNQSLYDAMIDLFEPGMTNQAIDGVFSELKSFLVPFVRERSLESSKAKKIAFSKVSVEKQREISLKVARALGYDFKGGRLDEAVHPFSTRIGPGDSRITTKFMEDRWNSSFYGTVHETGHSLYEQGLPLPGTQPIEKACSFGVHESQSLFWEDRIGRSREFIESWFGELRLLWEGGQGPDTAEALFQTLNRVEPGLIRIESDEVTYALHIFVRFEIERELIDGDLRVRDLPQVWNRKMKEYLGVEPNRPSQGCLQDVHWSSGAFGYFPSYALGHLYSAMFSEKMQKDIGSFGPHLSKRNYVPILSWLREKIHRRGFELNPHDLMCEVSGYPKITSVPFQNYLKSKFKS